MSQKRSTATLRKQKVLIQKSVSKCAADVIKRDGVICWGRMIARRQDRRWECEEKKQTRVIRPFIESPWKVQIWKSSSTVKVLKAVFCQWKHRQILLTKLITRNICLYTRHQIFAMRLKCLCSLGIDISLNCETVVQNLIKKKWHKLSSTLQVS